MQATNTKKVTITLVLNEEEARWLMGFVQNPMQAMRSQDRALEDPTEHQMRQELFNAISSGFH